jgi:predicted Zn-dependent peptidase
MPEEICGFTRIEIDKGVSLYIQRTSVFKTNIVKVYFAVPLEQATATKFALLPNVLKRGCSRFVNTKKIVRYLNSLYGAGLSYEISKTQEQQIVSFILTVVSERFLPKGAKTLSRGVEFLRRLLLKPALEKGQFKKDYIEQEKEDLKRFINARINERGRYAIDKCIEEMYKGERYCIPEYGRLEDIDSITPSELYKYYKEFLCTACIDIFVYGDTKEEKIARLVENLFYIKPRNPLVTPETMKERRVEKEKIVTERQDMDYARLVIGCRTYTTWKSPDIYAMIFYTGILGEFTHSRLFITVREKEALAYYIKARLEETNGLLLITAGLDSCHLEKAISLVKVQMQDLAEGNISDEEFESTRRSIIDAARTLVDNPSRWISTFYGMLVNKRPVTPDEIIQKFYSIKKEDVINAANKVKIDTIYTLKNV